MHGLVLLGKDGTLYYVKVLSGAIAGPYPMVIRRFRRLVPIIALPALLNSPGNFTAAKLAWVKDQGTTGVRTH